MAEPIGSLAPRSEPEADLSTAARLLREQTADSHRRVEQHLDLLDAPTPARMMTVLGLLGGFWASQEPGLDAWFACHPEVSASLQWARRARLPRLRQDLRTVATTCGVTVPSLVPGSPVFDVVDEAAVLGWLYVAEGSTLGGAVIDRSLQRAGFAARLTTFAPYPEGPQPMWRAYLAYLEDRTSAGPARVEDVVAAGVATFVALEQRVVTAATEVAA